MSEVRRGDDAYFAPLVRIIKGEDGATLAAFMHELQTRDIKDWNPERAARNAAGPDLARQKLLSLEPPLQWLLEYTIDPDRASVTQTAEDVGNLAECEAVSVSGSTTVAAEKQSIVPRQQMLGDYRIWAKTAQVRGATEFTGAETFWDSVKRLLNHEIFPGRRLFRSSGGRRLVALPPKRELLEGFNRLLGAKVVTDDADDPEPVPASEAADVDDLLRRGMAQARADTASVNRATPQPQP